MAVAEVGLLDRSSLTSMSLTAASAIDWIAGFKLSGLVAELRGVCDATGGCTAGVGAGGGSAALAGWVSGIAGFSCATAWLQRFPMAVTQAETPEWGSVSRGTEQNALSYFMYFCNSYKLSSRSNHNLID